MIDHAIAQDTDQRPVNIGQAVKALVVNGLGFVNRALYLTPQFFADKPTERLIGPGIRAEHLNDDVLGRALDTLYEHDVTTLFMLISAPACQRLGLTSSTAHLDSTSFHVDGDYDQTKATGVVTLTHGYRRDLRPDLNQVMLNRIVEQRAELPVLMQPLSGYSNDAASFGRLIDAHIEQLNTTHQVDDWVADSALYTAASGNARRTGASGSDAAAWTRNRAPSGRSTSIRRAWCPAGQVIPLALGKTAHFPTDGCRGGALRDPCAWRERGGRTLTLHPQEDLPQRLRVLPTTAEGRAALRERVAVEHGLAHLSQRQGNRARYNGTCKNPCPLRLVSAIQNLERAQALSEPAQAHEISQRLAA